VFLFSWSKRSLLLKFYLLLDMWRVVVDWCSVPLCVFFAFMTGVHVLWSLLVALGSKWVLLAVCAVAGGACLFADDV